MLEQGVQYRASDFIDLKSRVKAEMLRRCHEGSVASYGGVAYDFSTVPYAGLQMKVEQANKIIEPMNAIAESGFNIQNIGDPIMAMDQLNAKIETYRQAPIEGPTHHCDSSCSGLCYTTCATGCTEGCSGECGGNCTTSCSGTCTGSCTGGCSNSCSGGCSGYCGNDCGTSCLGGCKTTCSGNCSGGCQGYCGDTCSGTCIGTCSSNCSGSCTNSCTGGSTW